MSPDGNTFLVSTAGSGIYLKGLPTGDAAQINPGGREACFSPDGSRIAFVDIPAGETDYEVYIADLSADGAISNLKRLTYNDREDRHPTWRLVVWPACTGDIDLDGDADGTDMAYFLAAFAAGSQEGDLDGEGSVDSADVQRFAEHFGKEGCF